MIDFNQDGTFTVETSDVGQLGDHELHVRANLAESLQTLNS